jgi:hypothetical protein
MGLSGHNLRTILQQYHTVAVSTDKARTAQGHNNTDNLARYHKEQFLHVIFFALVLPHTFKYIRNVINVKKQATRLPK